MPKRRRRARRPPPPVAIVAVDALPVTRREPPRPVPFYLALCRDGVVGAAAVLRFDQLIEPTIAALTD
jgi:hypothetical protein